MKEDENKSAWSIEVGFYPGFQKPNVTPVFKMFSKRLGFCFKPQTKFGVRSRILFQAESEVCGF